jgi:hypothetical protein
LFQRALAIKAGGNNLRKEFSDLQLALHRELTCSPCILSRSTSKLTSRRPHGDAQWIADWNLVADLRRRLDAAVAQRKKGT